MATQDKDRIESAIRHIQTAADVDPWAAKIAVEAMRKQIPKEPIIPSPICPICHREIAAGDMHCIDCGQRISWEEEDDER